MSGLFSVLYRPPVELDPANLDHWRISDLRKIAGIWLERGTASKIPSNRLAAELKKALVDPARGLQVWTAQSARDREVLGVYARHGGTLSGRVVYLELLSRKLVRLELPPWGGRAGINARDNPVLRLRERRLLAGVNDRDHDYYYPSYTPEGMFPTVGIPKTVASHVEPAGPPPWTVKPGADKVESLLFRSPALVALDLSRAFTAVNGGARLKVNRSGELSTPSMRALEKALALPADADFPLADPAAFWFEMLQAAKLLTVDDTQPIADEKAAGKLLAMPEAWQAWHWAQAWLQIAFWSDGIGACKTDGFAKPWDTYHSQKRQTLAWTLGCLARQGEERPWFDLHDFLYELYDLLGPYASGYTDHHYGGYAWHPELPAARGRETKQGAERERAYWFAGGGLWYANALMVTLPALGLVERGRVPAGRLLPWCFRLTPLGRTVFGAPEVEPTASATVARFLVVQPNFDLVAYLDRADAHSAALLGRIAEPDARHSGPVQTFRLTQASVYRALESGLAADAVVEFLRTRAEGELPANVLRTLTEWSAKRESLVLRTGVTFRCFPSAAERDGWLKENVGEPCGERFAVLPGASRSERAARLLVVDHLAGWRQTFTLDEHGVLRTDEPVDLLQSSRLDRIAVASEGAWRLTAESVGTAVAGGLKRAQLHFWVSGLVAGPAPPLTLLALDAWAGFKVEAELADAVVLHVSDEAAFKAIQFSGRAAPMILAVLEDGWLLVRKDIRKEMLALLEELGLRVGKELKPGGSR